MSFFDEIAHLLYVWNTKIGDTEFEPFDFIEAKHNEAEFKGKVFYQNLIKAMPNHFGAKMRSGFFKEVVQYCSDRIKASTPQQTGTKTDKLKSELGKYGFFELQKVQQLSEPNKQRLVEMISTQGLPYSIAMFEYLGFLKHIGNEHFQVKNKLNKEVAKWFDSDKEGRAVKGNISVLSQYSREDKGKYTAHTHKETVKKDYQQLK